MHYRADFHIHSCLSPCASLEMSPASIVKAAKAAGLNAIALTDHNCGFNLPAFGTVCSRLGMACLYGMEVTSVEEAHILCLFDRLDAAMEMGARVYDSLPDIPNQPGKFGDQPIIDEDEDILGFAEKFLISASGFAVSSLVEEVHALGGLVIPAHIDRPVYGIIAQLGFLPDEPFDAVELTAYGDAGLAGTFPVIRSSDSHHLNGLGTAHTRLEAETLTVAQVRSSLWNA
ncbi:PHP domain-containing protein [Pontiella agarivorans]|uniref:PHP domain-containing protein n=1 Tax=Pontiella agarivorans TaxID=3038953 RepID=A0ABU5MSQ4_9BACT|nr:PHP domain-containing protein [Pontiella agarivorans]MDZ8117234.1 PHP domain-containing protein [Pontiella agarivorans]